MRLGLELKRLARHSVIYGLGGLVSRILAVLLLPLYTSYLATGSFGRLETVPPRPPPPALPELPRAGLVRPRGAAHRRDRGGCDHAAHGCLDRLLPLLLRQQGCGAPACRRANIVLVHDGDGDPRPRAVRRLR